MSGDGSECYDIDPWVYNDKEGIDVEKVNKGF